MSFLQELARKRAEKQKMSQQEHDEYLATLSNDETGADELRSVIKWVILPIFFLWVAYVGWIHLSKELIGVVPDEHVWWLAGGIPLVFQFIKAYCATKVLRAWHFKWFDKSAADFWIYLILTILTVFAFIWTLKISFWDVKDTARNNFVEQNTITLEQHLKSATADVDAQITQQKQKEAETGNLHNKRGKINWAVQPIAAENAKSSASLDEQRAAIIAAATKEFQSRTEKVEQQAKSRGGFFQRFGGFGEIGEILCFVLIGLLEAKLHRLNSRADSQNPPPPFHNENGRHHANATIHNQGRFTYFNRRDDGQVRSAYDNESQHPLETTVTQLAEPVTQFDGDGSANYADDVLKLALTRLQGHAANFDRKHGKNETTAQNIHDILDQTLFKMKGTFRPSPEIHSRFSDYILTSLLPLLVEKGFSYPKTFQFTGWLRSVGPQMQQAV